ncbi:MAG: hypothetical protein O7A63_08700 [Acidobacteria bacterium]|nr:hypothetical protein [Acidobacteriota bacterium]
MLLLSVAMIVVGGSAPNGSIAASPYSSGTIIFPDDPFVVIGYDPQPGWVKFTILTSDPNTVYFQDSNTYTFHYDFAVAELDPFLGMTPAEFDAVTLHEAGQQAILGAVILPPMRDAGQIPEYGIQFVRLDPYPPEQVRDLFELVRANVIAGPEVQAFYFPAYEQLQSAEVNREFFESQGIAISSTARWIDDNACYSHGWALGELKFFAADAIDNAYISGSLLPGDILLTDAVPAEIPFVAGVITLSPSTPNSHVSILANTYGVPFVHLAVAGDAQRAQDLLGHKMVLRAGEISGGCRIRLIDLEGVIDEATIAEILVLKEPPSLDISPVRTYRAYSAPTDGLQLSDIKFFGGKAANFGFLRRAIPGNSPVSAAFSFDLWDAFLSQNVSVGTTLRQEIRQRLSPYTYPPDMTALSATLTGIRALFKDTVATMFTSELQTAVIETLQDPLYGFDPNKKIRFRSSTNVEDSEQFTGAGLYDSFSGCLADDLDQDGVGPSLCDPAKAEERGVFRAIRKVFASFYNVNAYLERLRHGINEDQVGMALLVHHSFPDEFELANGVATFESFSGSDRALLVTQEGAVSVTNPEGGAIPEEVSVFAFSSGSIFSTLIRSSSLVQLGATVLDFPEEYAQLMELLKAVSLEFEGSTGLVEYILDFEYKKIAPAGDLVVKQVRQIPMADDVPSITPFLVNEPAEYCVFQGEFADVFGNHRLKSRLSLETRSFWLTGMNLKESIYTDAAMQYAAECLLHSQTGALSSWPIASHSYDAGSGVALDGWAFEALQNPRDYQLMTANIPALVAPSQGPVLVLGDLGNRYFGGDDGCLTLSVGYGTPVFTVDYTGPLFTTSESVLMCRCPEEQAGDIPQTRSFFDPSGIMMTTSFSWPPPPTGIVAGYTAPLVRFVQTEIAELTSEPIVLSGEYSQTYRPEHHNFGEGFIFEPGLDPGITPQQLQELEAAGVRAIHAFTDFGGTQITLYGDEIWGDMCLACADRDSDGDGFCNGPPEFDCDDTNPTIWAPPGETGTLSLLDAETLSWSESSEPGSDSLLYDTLRSGDPGDFVTATMCLESGDGSDTVATEGGTPAAGEAFFHLIRARNGCPGGVGPLGWSSDGVERAGRSCP